MYSAGCGIGRRPGLPNARLSSFGLVVFGMNLGYPLNLWKCDSVQKAWLRGVASGTRRHLPRPRNSAPGVVIVDGFLGSGYSDGEQVLAGYPLPLQINGQLQSCHPLRRPAYKCGNEWRSL